MKDFVNKIDAEKVATLSKALALIGVAFAVVLIAGSLVIRENNVPLLGALPPGDTAKIADALQGAGIPYTLQSGTIHVARSARYDAMLKLAENGLPKSPVKGYEILNELGSFTTSSKMFDATFLRAKEGELARTISAANHISSARVHISKEPAAIGGRSLTVKASVFVIPKTSISQSQANTIRFLVSSSVPGLDITNVALSDNDGNLWGSDSQKDSAIDAQKIEANLSLKALRLLESHVGKGNARVEVTVDRSVETQRTSEKIVKPREKVEISVLAEKQSETSSAPARGVGVASNLPDGAANGESNASGQSNHINNQRINYDYSTLSRDTEKESGDISRISAAVLINSNSVEPENFDSALISDIVSSALGLREIRGDKISVALLPFAAATEQVQPTAVAPGVLSDFDATSVSIVAITLFFASGLILIIFRQIKNLATPSTNQPQLDNSSGHIPTIFDGDSYVDSSAHRDELPPIDHGFVNAEESSNQHSIDDLQVLIEEKTPETLEILGTWLNPASEKKGA